MIDQKNQDSNNKKSNLTLKIVLAAIGVLLVFCGLLILGFLYEFGYIYFGPKTQLVLEPDVSLVSTVNPQDLEIDAQILTARARSMGIRISFEVSENNQIIAEFPNSINPESFVGNTVSIGLLELVDFGSTQPSEGAQIATDFDYEYFPQTAGTKWHALLTNKEFKEAGVTQDPSGRYQIAFALTPDGTKILSDYTTNNVGNYLAIVMDKVVISAPRVNAPIINGMGVISGNFTQEQAEAFAVFLRVKGPLPIPLKVQSVSEITK
jgi:preprotein translocase subunit SecD